MSVLISRCFYNSHFIAISLTLKLVVFPSPSHSWQALKGEPHVGNFKKFEYSSTSQRILALIIITCSGQHRKKIQTNSDIHSVSTRCRYNLHVPNTNLSKYQKGVYYTGIQLFNNLPHTIRSLNHDIKKLKPVLKEYFLSYSYSVEEFTSTKNSQLLLIHVSISSDAFLCNYFWSNTVVDCKSLSQLCNLYLY
jgi:hypothetical protein